MVIFSGLFTAFGRLIGAVTSMTIAWAAILLFGRVPQSRQTVLSFIALGSLGWVIAVLGVLVPTVGNLIVSAVPRTPQIEISWLRWTMILLAVFLPASVGLATILLLPVAGRSGVARPSGRPCGATHTPLVSPLRSSSLGVGPRPPDPRPAATSGRVLTSR